jgi:hypothetical protein
VTAPELSVVMVGRNDGYGGDFSGLMQTSLKTLAVGEMLTGIPLEAIVVEWNPPPGKPSIADLVPAERPSVVRVITVPPEHHEGLVNPGNLPLFEYLGKNVGARRAEAGKVLITNPDIIIFPAAVALSASGVVDEGAFVRIDRHDFRPPVPRDLQGAEVFGAALQGVFSVNVRIVPGERATWFYDVDPESPVGAWPTSLPLPFEEEIEPGLFVSDKYHGVGHLHTGMPGDFLLASWSTFDRARGYWERTDTFTHLDTYFMAQLFGAGARQAHAVSPYLILHEDHPRRMTGIADDWADVVRKCDELATGARPLPNGRNWGFAGEDFPERRFEAPVR